MSKPKGKITFRIAAVLFLVSAGLELISLDAAVPLFGAVHDGGVAVAYHLVYGALFAAAGYGLWSARRLGYNAVLAAAVLYTLDRGLLLLDRGTLQTYVTGQLASHGELAKFLDMDRVLDLMQLATGLFVLGWWGFVLYMYWRRAYFEPASQSPGPEQEET